MADYNYGKTFEDAWLDYSGGRGDSVGGASGGVSLVVNKQGAWLGYEGLIAHGGTSGQSISIFDRSGGISGTRVLVDRIEAKTSISSATISGGTIYATTISGATWEGQKVTQGYLTYTITGASDMNEGGPLFESTWNNSGMKWDDISGKWVKARVLAKGDADGEIQWCGAGNLFNAESKLKWANGLETLFVSGTISGNKVEAGQYKKPPMLFNIANIRLSANQNINVTQFDCPTGEIARVWQASVSASGGIGISGMWIEMLAGSTLPLDGGDTIYKTSSQILQSSNPLGQSSAGDHVEIRLMYSGGANGLVGNGYQYGTGFMNISVY